MKVNKGGFNYFTRMEIITFEKQSRVIKVKGMVIIYGVDVHGIIKVMDDKIAFMFFDPSRKLTASFTYVKFIAVVTIYAIDTRRKIQPRSIRRKLGFNFIGVIENNFTI